MSTNPVIALSGLIEVSTAKARIAGIERVLSPESGQP
jgi:hypothetical protein